MAAVESYKNIQSDYMKSVIGDNYIELNKEVGFIAGNLERKLKRANLADLKRAIYSISKLACFNEAFEKDFKKIKGLEKFLTSGNGDRLQSSCALRNRMIATICAWDEVSTLLRKHDIITIKSKE